MKFLSVAIALVIAGSSSRAAAELVATGVDLAVVSRGLADVPSWPVVVATKTGIVFEGKSITTLDHGYLDPADKEGGAMGVKIERLAKVTEIMLASMKPPPPGITVVLDQTTPYRTMIEMVYSMKTAGLKQFGFVAKTGTKLGVVSLTLPDKPKAAPPAKDGPLKMVVAVTKDKMMLWSLSEKEGTLKAPKLTVARGEFDKLTAGLAEIVKRRFPSKRTGADRQIILMAEEAISMKDVFGVLTAIRTTADGSELFPDVQLSSGFM